MEDTLKDLSTLRYYEITEKNPLFIKLRLSSAKTLYHYTTRESANSILQSNKFWVTRCDHLADKLEIKYIHYVLSGVVGYLEKEKESYKVKAKQPYAIIDPIIMTFQALRDLYKQGGAISCKNIYLLSLSENRNNKYLIDNYCYKDGCILELKNNIEDIFPNVNGLFTTLTAKVEYDYGKQMELIIEDLNEFFYELHVNVYREKVVDFNEIVETIKTVIYAKVINYSFFFKHENFSQEEEYRVVFLVNNNDNFVKYRLNNGKPLSYYEAEIKNKNLITKKYI